MGRSTDEGGVSKEGAEKRKPRASKGYVRQSITTTVTIDGGLRKQIQTRWSDLDYASFSQYVAALMEIDLRERPDHILVKKAGVSAASEEPLITTITYGRNKKDDVVKRWHELDYPSFNQYVEALINIDLRLLPDHVLIRTSKKPAHSR